MATEKQIPAMMGRLVEHQDCFRVLSVKDAQWVFQNPKEAIALSIGAIKTRSKDIILLQPEPFLQLISGGESLVIDAVDGTEIIAKAKKVFPAGIDGDFERWSADESGQATPEIIPSVYEMSQDATFSQMFGSLNADARNLCFTQHQIINFVEKYLNWLWTDGYGTFFLFPSQGHFFVAFVRVDSDRKLRVDVYRFECSDVWYARDRFRVVVPQLAV